MMRLTVIKSGFPVSFAVSSGSAVLPAVVVTLFLMLEQVILLREVFSRLRLKAHSDVLISCVNAELQRLRVCSSFMG